MPEPLQLTSEQARRVAVRAQRLDAERPADVDDVVRAVGLVQIDPTRAVAPTADLVMASRLGRSYDARDLADAVDEQRLVEVRGHLRPPEQMALLRADMEAWPAPPEERRGWHQDLVDWMDDNEGARLEVLDLLRAEGPLRQKQVPDTCRRPWRSSGWNNGKNAVMLLEQMGDRGEVAVAGREGRERLWDLAERVWPDDPVPPLAEARHRRDVLRLRSLGLLRATGPDWRVEPQHVAPDVGLPAVVEGVKGEWRVDPDLADDVLAGRFEPRAALLSPYDRLIHDRRRMEELFAFDYQLEMYKPADKRRWGYYALPVLVGDRLVGKLDATADRRAGALRVDAVHQDEPLDDGTRAAVEAEIDDLATWLRLDLLVADDAWR